MVEHSKRKKHHDKDKYYNLAKEQGLRSRAAFKLVQINRKFSLLEKCSNAVLDLCAAPGGWTQICSQTCPRTCQIIAVDILPIRPLKGNGHNNITTLIGDITTAQCQAEIRKTLKRNLTNSANNSQVDVVLHDGAPNIGADYSKDAYEQNELSLHALKCATNHLKRGGSFVTKLYRSADYAKYLYVLQQLFDQVHAFKPKASRMQSAEIFLIALDYKAPAQLDPRFLDPRHVFASVAGDTSMGGIDGSANAPTMTIFHKQFGQQKKHRSGYDLENFYDGVSLQKVESASDFCAPTTSFKEAVAMLSRCTSLAWKCETCQPSSQKNKKDDGSTPTTCHCSFYQHHPLTTTEVRECLSDLKVLNKSDFKGLLMWRSKMQDAVEHVQEEQQHAKDKSNKDDADADDEDSDEESTSSPKMDDSDREEDEIQAEIADLQKRRQRERKRLHKKERAAAAKRRKHAALNNHNLMEELVSPEDDKVFSLATITSRGDLEAAAEVNLDHVTDDMWLGGSDDEDVIVGGQNGDTKAVVDPEDRWKLREKELDAAYDMYLQTTKNGLSKSGTKMAKRSKKLQRLKVAQEAAEDQEMALATPAGIDYDTKAYVELLRGPKSDSDDDDESSDDDDNDNDGFNAEPMLPEEHAAIRLQNEKNKKKDAKKGEVNPLIHKFADEPASAKTARWFSNPLFASIGEVAQSTAAPISKKPASAVVESEDDHDDNSSTSDDASPTKKRSVKMGLDADDVLALIPKTDKQIRHERRLKQMARDERKKAWRAKKLGEEEDQFEIAPADDVDGSGDEQLDKKLEHLSEAQRKKVLEARELIKAGMGTLADSTDDPKSTGIEVVPQGNSGALPVIDKRKYDSDNEEYDSDDYARTLALGTMMLRRSKEKAFADASYNRYAWNDPEGLPEWFVDDENRHYRPQLPIPPALLAKMKEKMMALSTKPIAKVAEARARKNKRAKTKLAAAKKQAEAVANNPDMSEAMKLKAISKALRGQESRKPGKTYVVAKKGRASKYSKKGVKMVDKRMKSDKRGMDRKDKRSGKKGKRRT